ncbi:MarR family winged helix-turn-helix transcriptional regulator [Brevundimonas sp.]|uniref:MarR family winged helix-turn-helix transcriptional regulator n=1 Tax=Brevundimonas sp. TaxID=1871086 RepID=UPI002D440D42|nr:MarR family transcriptional regulator [Brevundimonas sp.]HYC98848.1 MarR family transcriptional regulator [Brevundimonas sp.]
MDDFIHSQGIIWLPHILRRLSNRFVEACDEVFEDFGLIVPPNMVSVVHLLYERGPQSVMSIATTTTQSHPLINKYVKALRALGLVSTETDPGDRRRTIVSLTEDGRQQAVRLLEAREAFVPAFRRLLDEADADVFEALWRVEKALISKPFGERILAERNRVP